MCTKCEAEGGFYADEDETQNGKFKCAAEWEHGSCPIAGCEGKLERRYTCPGYETGGKIYRCSSGCSNAIRYTCPECYWSWQDTLHERAYNYEENEANKPPSYFM